MRIGLGLDWVITEQANRPLPSIEGSDRLAISEMNSDVSSQLEINWQLIGSQLTFHLQMSYTPFVVQWHSIGIQLALHWKSIDIPLAFNWKSIDIPLVVDWHSIGVNWNTIDSQWAFCLQTIRIPLVVQCHSIVSQLAHWRWIGRLQIRPTSRIWPKPKLLIGRELEMLASHWSRGPSGKFQRGYPYDP